MASRLVPLIALKMRTVMAGLGRTPLFVGASLEVLAVLEVWISGSTVP